MTSSSTISGWNNITGGLAQEVQGLPESLSLVSLGLRTGAWAGVLALLQVPLGRLVGVVNPGFRGRRRSVEELVRSPGGRLE